MTALAFMVFGVIAFLWWTFAGRTIYGPLTVWYFWFLTTFAVCGYYVFRRGDLHAKAGWLALAAFWIVGQVIWAYKSPYYAHAYLHAATGTFFAFSADRRSQLWISGLFMAAMGIDWLAYHGAITEAMLRPRQFVAFAYPDLLAAVSYAAVIILASPFDGGGRRIKLPLGEPGGMVGHTAHVRVHRSADPGEG